MMNNKLLMAANYTIYLKRDASAPPSVFFNAYPGRGLCPGNDTF